MRSISDDSGFRNRCYSFQADSFFEDKRYFENCSRLPRKYNWVVDLLKKNVPGCFPCLKQKISIIQSERELATHLEQFKKAIPCGKTGKFSCFIFDTSCTFVVDMYYGNPRSNVKYHEICLYDAPIHIIEDASRIERTEADLMELKFYDPSRLPSSYSQEPDIEEEGSDEEDECPDDISLEPEPLESGQRNFDHESSVVRSRNGYNFIISVIPSLESIKRLSSENIKIKQSCHMQLLGSAAENAAISILFREISQCLISGHHDEMYTARRYTGSGSILPQRKPI